MEWQEFERKFPQKLNKQQKEAVQSVEGPVLLLAVPGSGKTTVLVTRLGYMIYAKGCPGSHVIVKNKGRGELPDATYEDAARLAAHYSSAGSQNKAEVDYVEKKQVKKPNGGKPGFVVYYTNYSMMADTDISDIEKADA